MTRRLTEDDAVRARTLIAEARYRLDALEELLEPPDLVAERRARIDAEVAAILAAEPDLSANAVFARVRGERALVLAAVRALRTGERPVLAPPYRQIEGQAG